MENSRKYLGNAYIYERCKNGDYRAILENGESYFVRDTYNQISIEDIGTLFYKSDGRSYGIVVFNKNPDVIIDYKQMQDNYNRRWNANIVIT